nr:Xaa-Pro peptidase family protein [Clostridiales bacterium]
MIPLSEFKDRVKRLQARMEKEGYDYILAYGNEAEPQYVRYLSDYWPSFETAGVLVPSKGKPFLLIGPESYTYASDRSMISDIRLVKAFRESSEPEYPGKKLDTFESVFEEAGITDIKRFGVAGYPLMTVGVYFALEESLKKYGILPEKADSLINDLRMIKSENELSCMRRAADITHATMDYVIENIKVGMTETQVVGLALGKMHELGAERESYPLWVLTGDGSDQAISRPRHKAIEKNDLTFIQIGARYGGYASTIGRSVVFGKASDEQKNLIMAGYAIQKEMIGALRAGRPAREIALMHKQLVNDLGYGDYYLYGPFHGNGLMEGEAPWIE